MTEQAVNTQGEALQDTIDGIGSWMEDYAEFGLDRTEEVQFRLIAIGAAIHHDLTRIAELLTVMCDR